MRRFLRSTRGRLVLFQVLMLGIASAVSAYAIYQLVSRPLVSASDDVLYGQWTTVAGGITLNPDGTFSSKPGVLPPTYGDPPVPVETVVYAKDGTVIAQTARLSLPGPDLWSQGQNALNSGGGYFDAREPRTGSPRRGYADQVILGDQPNQVPVAVVVTKSTSDLEFTIRRLLLTLVAGAILVVAVAGALAWVVVGRTLRPVRALSNTAREISEQELHRRVEVPTPDDEVGELKATFNQLLARLEQSFQGLRRFTADASHELRSPLALIRTEVDVALTRARGTDDYERVLHNVQDEVEHMSRVIDQLLLLAQADAGNLNPVRAEVDVADFVEETAARWQPVAAARGVTLEVDAPATGVVEGDPVLLRTVIDNLVDNAIRYSPTLAPVTLTARRSDGEWLVEVADRGPGVPHDMRERIFERFARADSVRTRRGGGVGLGLALSAAVVEAHGGRLELVEQAHTGACFRVHLPAESPN
ncbi:MAG: ATP-binding protein [Candidatus Dormibacteraeota bacterium]|nr:ATP-binding protein [Candidatus Dormibacteraeota bacterium]